MGNSSQRSSFSSSSTNSGSSSSNSSVTPSTGSSSSWSNSQSQSSSSSHTPKSRRGTVKVGVNTLLKSRKPSRDDAFSTGGSGSALAFIRMQRKKMALRKHVGTE